LTKPRRYRQRKWIQRRYWKTRHHLL